MLNDPRTDAEVDTSRMPFGDHLEELRVRMVRALVGLAVATILSLLFARRILGFILTPVLVVLNAHGERPELQALSPQEPFLLYLKVGFLSGVLVGLPWLSYQAWRFVSTGLYARERRFAKLFAPVAVGLFATGVAFMYVVVLPIMLTFFVKFNQSFDLPNLDLNVVQRALLDQDPPAPAPSDAPPPLNIPVLDAHPADPQTGDTWYDLPSNKIFVQTPNGTYATPLAPVEATRAISSRYSVQFFVSLVFGLALGFGIAFELPVLVVFLSATGIAGTREMARARKYVALGIVVGAAILTPPDVISQILLAVPMFALFEAGLLAGGVFERRRNSQST